MEACMEIINSVMLLRDFINIYQPNQPLRQEVLKISILPVSSSDDVHVYDVKVNFIGLGSHYIDGKNFVTNLFRKSAHLNQLKFNLLRFTTDSVITSNTMSVIEGRLWCSSNRDEGQSQDIILHEYFQENSTFFSGLLLELEEISLTNLQHHYYPYIFCNILHLLHIINPKVDMSLVVTDKQMLCNRTYNFTSEPSIPIPSSPYAIPSAMCHYVDTNTSQSEFILFRGVSRIISHCSSQSIPSTNIKVYCCIALLPFMKPPKGFKLHADCVCNIINISIFGPGKIPIHSGVTGVQFNIYDLAIWKNYGIIIGGPIHPSSDNVIHCHIPSASFNLKKKISSVSDQVLQIFIFFEQLHPDQEHRQWFDDFVLHSSICKDFGAMISAHANIFQATLHSSLDKLFYNYSSCSMIECTVQSSVPLLAKSISDIIMCSRHHDFVNECTKLISVPASDCMPTCLIRSLNEIAGSKLSMTLSSSRCSDEQLKSVTSSNYLPMSSSSQNDDETADDYEKQGVITHIESSLDTFCAIDDFNYFSHFDGSLCAQVSYNDELLPSQETENNFDCLSDQAYTVDASADEHTSMLFINDAKCNRFQNKNDQFSDLFPDKVKVEDHELLTEADDSSVQGSSANIEGQKFNDDQFVPNEIYSDIVNLDDFLWD